MLTPIENLRHYQPESNAKASRLSRRSAKQPGWTGYTAPRERYQSPDHAQRLPPNETAAALPPVLVRLRAAASVVDAGEQSGT